MGIIDMYCNFVLKPVEEYTKKLRYEVYNKKLFKKIFQIIPLLIN